MKKILLPLLLLLLGTKLPAQICTVIDSFRINSPAVDTYHMQVAEGIAFSGGRLWVSSTSAYERDYYVTPIHMFAYDLAGNRVDSIPYYYGGNQIISMAADGTYIWAMRMTTDSIYKFNIATKSLVATYGMGGRGTAEPGYRMASIGDTLYFVGGSGGKCFKFKKSTATFYDYPNYLAHTGVYPSGMCAVGSSLVTTTVLQLNPAVDFDNVSTTNPGTMKENISTRQNWCIDIPSGLTFGGGYFWQLKTFPFVFDIRTTYVYQIQSSFSSLATGVNDVVTAADFVASPNPASDMVNITLPSNKDWESSTVSIYSITGSKIFSKNIEDNTCGKMSIDLRDLNVAPGMYLIQLTNGVQQITKKVTLY